MAKEPLFISICNQKGGIGKTTYTILVASILHYRLGYEVLVADCDYPQWSIHQQRQRDHSTMERSDYYKLMMLRQFRQTERKVYPVLNTRVETSLRDVRAALCGNAADVDVVLFDLPGTIGTKGVLSLLSNMNHVFVPMKADKAVMESSITFARTLNESFIKPARGPLRSIHMFWTMIDRRERTQLYRQYEQVLESYSLPLLESRIPMRARFSREIAAGSGPVFRSTLYPPDRLFAAESGLDDLIAELCTITQIG